jgi:hypothetical protein
MTTLEQSPYSPDLALADFYQFPQLKSALKGRRFCDAADIIKNATESLKGLHKMASRNISNTLKVASRRAQLQNFETDVA